MDDGRQEGRPGSRGGVLEFLVWFRTFLVYFVVTWGGTAKGTTKLHEDSERGTTKRHEDSERSRNGGRGGAGGRTGTTKYTKVYEKARNLDGGAVGGTMGSCG